MAAWEQQAKVAQDYRDASLSKVEPRLKPLPDVLPLNSQPLAQEYLTEREFELTQKYDAIQLLELLRSRKVSAEEVTRAFLRRAALAQYATNCVTELMWDEAVERAKYLDSLPEPLGAFHGLPISVKEYHSMKGKPTHGSMVSWIGSHSLNNQMNDILWDAGCVFYCRTTGPQALMHLECISNIYGRTVNPYNRNLTSGGSSGGEGALVGFRGSVFGLGGDIGGSVRGPAADCGVYGFKPTSKRVPSSGSKNPMQGKDSINSTMGPLSVSREAINLFMKTLMDAEPWRQDPSLTVKPWTPETFTRPLRIAIEWHDDIVRPHPPVTRALRLVADACRAAGHDVVDWQPYEHDRAWSIVSRLYFPDGGRTVLAKLAESGEPVLPLTEWILRQPGVKEHGILEYWALVAERDAYREAHARHWNATATGPGAEGEVDVIVAPVTPGAAPLHDTSKYWHYTSQWNLVDYPACAFPVTFVDQHADVKDAAFVPMSDRDAWNWDLYSPERYANAPVCLQVVARKGLDEKCLAALEVIEKAMGRP